MRVWLYCALITAARAVVTITSPDPSNQPLVQPGEYLPITWGSSEAVTGFILEYSADNGENWVRIPSADFVAPGSAGNATPQTVNWLVPSARQSDWPANWWHNGSPASYSKIRVTAVSSEAQAEARITIGQRDERKRLVIITHGFILGGAFPAWPELMARKIIERTGSGKIIRFNHDGADAAVIEGDGSPNELHPTGATVVIYDWARVSNNLDGPLDPLDGDNSPSIPGWREAAGDLLANFLHDSGLVRAANEAGFNQQDQAIVPIHFIGHSFGAVVTNQAIRRLAYSGIKVDQMTTLDPHDINQSQVADAENDPQVTVWSNVRFADNYWQDNVGNPNDPSDGINPALPVGHSLVNAYDRNLTNETSNTWAVINDAPYSPHSRVWGWYFKTISGANAADDVQELSSNPSWYSGGDPMEFGFKLTQPTNRPAEYLNRGESPPVPPTIFNGDFSFDTANATIFGPELPGYFSDEPPVVWSIGGKKAALLNGRATSALTSRFLHRAIWIPENANALELSLRATQYHPDTIVSVDLLGDDWTATWQIPTSDIAVRLGTWEQPALSKSLNDFIGTVQKGTWAKMRVRISSDGPEYDENPSSLYITDIKLTGSAPLVSGYRINGGITEAAPTTVVFLPGAGSSITLEVVATDGVVYQWQRRTAGSSTWANLANGEFFSGATTAQLTILNPVTTYDGDEFQVVVSNTGGTATGGSITLVLGSDQSGGLIGDYRFNGNTSDSSGHGAAGTAYGGITYSSGISGQAALLDGASGYIDIPDAIMRPMTASAWVKLDSDAVFAQVSTDPTNVSVAVVDGWSLRENFMLRIWKDSSGDLRAAASFHDWVGPNNGPTFESYPEMHIQSSRVLQFGTWYHLAMTYDESTLRLYVNGQLEASMARPTTTYAAAPTGTPDLRIGVHRFNSGFFKGAIDDVLLYNRALAPAEIAGLTSGYVNPAPQTVVQGSTAIFSVPNLSAAFQWQRKPVGSTTWSDLVDGFGYAGTQTPTLTIAPTSVVMNGDAFRVVVTVANAGPVITAEALLTVSTTASGLPSFYWNPAVGGNGHTYYIAPNNITWAQAEAMAQTLGGHLATVNSLAENNWLLSIWPQGGYIGFNDLQQEGNFVWTSGENSSFTNWSGGEPNDNLGAEDITILYTAGWSDGTADINPWYGYIEVAGPGFAVTPASATVQVGANMILTVVGQANGALSYQWRKNGVNLPGETSTTLTLTNVQLGDAASYDVVVSATNPPESDRAYTSIAASLAVVSPSASLIGWWQFDGDATDYSGNGRHGQIVGNVTATANRSNVAGAAMQLNGGYIDLPNIMGGAIRPVTAAAWVKVAPGTVQGYGGHQGVHIVDAWNAPSTRENFMLRLVRKTDGTVRAAASFHDWLEENTYYPETHLEESAHAISEDEWHHVAMTYDGSVLRVYVDGQLSGSETRTGTPYVYAFAPETDLKIGRHDNGNTLFYGALDDVRIYDRTLSAAEITYLFAEGDANQSAGLAARYEFSGNANDSSSNGYSGTITGGVSFTSSGNRDAAHFDGSTGYINIDTRALDNIESSDHTLAIWVKGGPFNDESIILQKQFGAPAGGNPGWFLETFPGNKVRYARYTIEGGVLTWGTPLVSTTQVGDGQWHHVAVVVVGGMTRMYIDGQLEASAATGSGTATNTADLGIGRRNAFGDMYFAGELSDLRIYSRALSMAEITGLFPPVALVVQASPAGGGNVAGAGTYSVNTTQTISATPNTAWVFAGWNDGSMLNPRQVNIPINGATFTASFSVIVPTVAAASEITTVSFRANWGAVSGIYGLLLDVATDSAFTNYLEGYSNRPIDGNAYNESVSGLNPGTTYYYRVRTSYLPGGPISANSDTIEVTTAILSAPVPFAQAASNISQTGFQANWAGVSGAQGLRLDVAADVAFSNFVAGFNNRDINGNATNESVTGLSPGTTYYYRLRSYVPGDVTSGNSNVVAVSTSLSALQLWQQDKFTPAERLDANVSGPNAIYGHDGLPNLVKYALGLEPKQNITTGLPVVGTLGSDWTYTYTRPDNISDVTCTVEYSTNLTNWTSVGVAHELVSNSGGVDTWRGRVPLSTGGNVFFRLKVTQP